MSQLRRVVVAELGDGDVTAAVTHHTAALALAGDDLREQLARGHAGLGAARRRLGDATLAREHLVDALDLYVELGVPEVEPARAWLAAFDREAGTAS